MDCYGGWDVEQARLIHTRLISFVQLILFCREASAEEDFCLIPAIETGINSMRTNTPMTAEPKIPAKFMRPRRYAERVSINWRTCYHYIDQGLFPAYKFQGVVLLDVEECDAILKGLVRRVAPRYARKTKSRKAIPA